ncbi:MAG TPA: parallel beta-helix domain-containing protein, partial [Anaeromyxobacteraceae bacterium]|nr:parallel beta-helix domain-containing protein [Anaeromyxobacteraceae bacterium]
MHTTSRLLATALVVAVLACGDDDDDRTNDPSTADPCEGIGGTCVGFPAGTPEATIAGAIAQAQPGTTFAFGAGTFRFTNSLQVGADGITIRGAGRETTTLDFAGVGPEGIGAEGVADFTVQDLGVVDASGNCIKVTDGERVTFRNVKTWWTNPDPSKHGGYGIYPVLSTHVLVEGCYAEGASDTGIYVGQSDNIVVRNNEATGNVAGIEIENCTLADVHDNHVHGNAGGILAFNLPLPKQPNENQVRIFDNVVEDNDGENFAAPGNVVALVPTGTGLIILANRKVEVFGNTFRNNGTAAIAIANYGLAAAPPEGFDPFPGSVHVHGNTFENNGTAPDQGSQLGAALDVIMGDAR